ncbi:hypothetical protein KC317_g12827 [Hortaea werneckii]|nr:hypothetical protein KC317_g12827 [Hortaea werneckii]KAI7601970.1 hypothetical protein KC346_g12569 [Hortaea werneckii]
MPVTSTIYSGVESVTATGTSAEPHQGTTELVPAGPETITKTVTISNVEIPWTTTKPTSQELVTSIFTTTIDGSNSGVLETTTIVQGNGPQTTVAIQPGETAESMDRPSYVYTTVTYTSRLSPPFQNPNNTSATAATASTNSTTTNDTKPPNFSLTTVTSTFQVPASTAIETQYTTTLVSGDTTQTVVVTERPSNSPASTAKETQYTTTFVSGNDTQSVVVTEGPSNSQSSLLSSSPASEPNLTSTFTNTANGRPNSRSSSQVSSTLSSAQEPSTAFPNGTSTAGQQLAAHFDVWIDIIYAPRRTANNTVGPGVQWHILCTFQQPVDFVAERPHYGIFDNARAAVKHSVFNESAFIGPAAVNDYECLHDLERFLGPSAFEVVRLIKRSHKPASHLPIKLFATSGVVYSAVSIIERFGIAALFQLLILVSGTIFSLAVLSKFDPGVPAAFESAQCVNYNYIGFDFNEPSALWSASFHLLNDVRASSFDFVGLIECAISYPVVIIRIECPTSSILKLFACSASDFFDLSAKPDLQLTELSKCDGRSAPNFVDVPGRPVLQLSKCNGRSVPHLLDFSGRPALRVVKLFACSSYYLFDISSRPALQFGERIGRSAHNLLDFSGRPGLQLVKFFACSSYYLFDLSRWPDPQLSDFINSSLTDVLNLPGSPAIQLSKLVGYATSYFSDLIRTAAFQLVKHFDCTAFNFIGRIGTAAFTFSKLFDCFAFKLSGLFGTSVFDIFHLVIWITSDFWNLVKLVDPVFFHVFDVIQLVDCPAFNLFIFIELVRDIVSNRVSLRDFDAKSYFDFAGWIVVYDANSDKFSVQPHIKRAVLYSARFDEFGSQYVVDVERAAYCVQLKQSAARDFVDIDSRATSDFGAVIGWATFHFVRLKLDF